MTNEDNEKIEKLLEIVADAGNALEALAINLKRQVAELAGEGRQEPDLNKLFWEQKQGEKGPFEQTSEKANNNSDAWKRLKARLKEHNGFWQHAGYKFWFDMKQETVIDRRKVV